MKILYMGTADIALLPLKKLKESSFEIVGVITQPDRPNSKRGNKIIINPIKSYALEQGITVLQPEKIRSEEALNEIKALGAHAAVVCAYGQLLSQSVLNIFELGAWNIHASLLPAYRGAAPISRAIINGEKETGITIMKMAAGLDSGDMLISRSIAIENEANAGELTNKLSVLGAECIVEALKMIESGKITLTEQKNSDMTYAQKLTKEDQIIDFSLGAQRVHDLIRGLAPEPKAKTSFKGNGIFVLKAQVKDPIGDYPPGKVIGAGKAGIVVGCGCGSVLIEVLKPQGKGEMSAYAFYNGIREKAGAHFGE